MKKTLVLLTMIAALASCGGSDNSGNNNAAENTTPSNETAAAPEATPAQPVDISENPDYKKGLALIGKSDCLGCHKVSEKLVGPSYQDVAAKYAGQPGIEDTLANKIIKGGSGNWGEMIMSPHPTLSHEDAVAMAKYILLLKQ